MSAHEISLAHCEVLIAQAPRINRQMVDDCLEIAMIGSRGRNLGHFAMIDHRAQIALLMTFSELATKRGLERFYAWRAPVQPAS